MEYSRDQLVATVQEMADCYLKHFGANLQTILNESYSAITGDQTDSNLVNQTLRRIQEHYANINFARLQGKEQLYPLFVVRDILPQLEHAIEGVFKKRT
ncbi:MAG: hypothetical protein AABX78_01080, partial [Nanoarchaeota archaeon]